VARRVVEARGRRPGVGRRGPARARRTDGWAPVPAAGRGVYWPGRARVRAARVRDRTGGRV